MYCSVFTGEYINTGGIVSTISSSNLEVVNKAFVLVILNGDTILIKINQALVGLDPSQSGTVLQLEHVRAFGIVIDAYTMRHVLPNGNHSD